MADQFDPATDPLGAAMQLPYAPDPATDPLGEAMKLPAGTLIPSETPGVVGLSPEHHLKSRLRQERTWEQVAPELEKAGVDPEQYRQNYQLEEARAVQKGEGIGTVERWLGGSIPFGSAIRNWRDERKLGEATKAFQEGKATGEQIGLIARHERMAEVEKGLGTGASFLAEATKIPAILGEFAAGGSAVRGLGLVKGTGIGARAAAGALATPAVPSTYLAAGARNQAANPDESLFQSYAPPVAMAMAQNAVLGQLQGLFSGANITRAGRIGAKTVVGMGESAAADVATTGLDRVTKEVTGKSLGLDTKWGTLGAVLRGDEGSKKAATVQFLTFSVFSAMHSGREIPHEVFQKAVDSAKPEQVAEVGQQVQEGKFDPETPGPLGDLGRQYADVVASARARRERQTDNHGQPQTSETETPQKPAVDPAYEPSGDWFQRNGVENKGFDPTAPFDLSAKKPPMERLADLFGEKLGRREEPYLSDREMGLRPPEIAELVKNGVLKRVGRLFTMGDGPQKPAEAVPEQPGQVPVEMPNVAPDASGEAAGAEKGPIRLSDPQNLKQFGGEPMQRRLIHDETGREVGKVDTIVRRTDKGVDLHVEHLGERNKGINEEGAELGIPVLREVFRKLIADHPEATDITGLRTSGARAGLPKEFQRVRLPIKVVRRWLRAGDAKIGGKEPAPSGPIEDTVKLIPQSLKGIAKKAGLTNAESEILAARLNPEGEMPSFEELTKTIMGPSGKPVKRQRLQQLEKAALEKLVKVSGGKLPGSVAGIRASLGYGTKVEKGGNVSAAELHAPEDAAAGQKGAKDQLEALTDKMLAEADAGTLTPERKAWYKAEAERIAARQKTLDTVFAPQAAHGLTEREAMEHVADEVFDNPHGITAMKFEPAAIPPSLKAVAGQKAGQVYAALKEKLASAVKSVVDNWHELAGQVAPRTARMSEQSANDIARHIASPVYVERAMPAFFEKVLGPITGHEGTDLKGEGEQKDKDAVGRRFMAALYEERFRHARTALAKESKRLEAEARREVDDVKKRELYERAADYMEKANDVRTFIGRENAEMDTEASFQKTVGMKEYQAFKDRLRTEFVPVAEKFYRMAEGLEEDAPVESLTQLPDLPFTAKAIKPADAGDPKVVVMGGELPAFTGGPTRGRVTNVRQGKIGAARIFTGKAEGYDIDPKAVMENMLRDRVLKATKAQMYRTLVDSGLAKWGSKREPTETEDGRKMIELPVEPPRGTQAAGKDASLYVHPDAEPDVRKALGLDKPWKSVPGAPAFTRVALMAFVETATHGKNIGTMVFKPGVSPRDIAKNAWGVITGNAEVKAKLVDLAEMGAMKPRGAETGNLWGGKYDPTVYLSKSLDFMDSVMRLTASQAYDRLVRTRGLKASEFDKRNFINQLGQYMKRGQNDLVAFFRDTGIGPFATAGTNYTAQGLRTLFGDTGLKAPNLKTAALLRAEFFARVSVPFVAAAVYNMLAHGRPDGDENTPIGGLKLGKDSNGKTAYLDLGAMSGLTRGARTVGLLALLEGQRTNTGHNAVAKRAVKDFAGAVTHPFEGPGVGVAHAVVTGENTGGFPVAEKAKPGENQVLLNLQGALANANPVVSVLSEANRPGKDVTTAEKVSNLFGPFGVKFRAKPPVVPEKKK